VGLILDTGAEHTILSQATADRLQLPQNRAYPRTLRGIGGAVVSGAVELPGLAAAGTVLRNFGALVGSIDLPSFEGVVPDGLLGADILSSFELDLDLRHGILRLYDPLFCRAPAADWGQAYAVIEANRSLHDRLFFPALLNGQRLAVIFDTGAQRSLLDLQSARTIGADMQALDREPTKTVRGVASSIQARLYRFRKLEVGGQSLPDPILLVAPLNLNDADLVLGNDYLRSRRVWLSYGSHRIFLAHPPRDDPVFSGGQVGPASKR
jgi:predicted aspartyl protease